MKQITEKDFDKLIREQNTWETESCEVAKKCFALYQQAVAERDLRIHILEAEIKIRESFYNKLKNNNMHNKP